MPLEKSSSPEAFKKNVAELIHSNYPQKQAVAIAYSNKREAERHEHEKKKFHAINIAVQAHWLEQIHHT